jgi:hypothetical protein
MQLPRLILLQRRRPKMRPRQLSQPLQHRLRWQQKPPKQLLMMLRLKKLLLQLQKRRLKLKHH